MLVKAKWNVKDAGGWHSAGDVFQTEAELGDAVEVLDAPKKPEAAPVPEPVKEPEAPAEAKAEKPKTSARRKTTR